MTTTERCSAASRCLSTSSARTAPSSLAFLTRFSQDTQNGATAMGAFLAGLPQAPKRRAKTSSERGRAFREQRLRHEEELHRLVAALQNDIVTLEMRRKTWETRCLNRPSSLTGSLAQLSTEYHRLFAHGLSELPPEPGRVAVKRVFRDDDVVRRTKLQEEFLRRVIDESGTVGNMIGPEASIVQWRRYALSHDRFHLEVKAMEVSAVDGEADDGEQVVMITADCLVHAGLSDHTINAMFPHIRSDPDLLDRVVGVKVTYPATRRFQFTRDDRIAVETVDVDFVVGLKNAGLSLAEIAQLMACSTITSDSMIVEAEAPPQVLGGVRSNHIRQM